MKERKARPSIADIPYQKVAHYCTLHEKTASFN